jgi:hypothetical protein
LFEEGQVIRATGVDNIVSHNNCPFPYSTQTLKVLEIREIKVLHVIDEDHIKSSVILYKGIFRLKCPYVNFDSISHTCMLMNSAGNISELNARIDSVDDGVGGMCHDK